MSRQFRIHTPTRARSYDSDSKALAFFMDCPLEGHEIAVLTDFGETVAARYGGDGVIKTFGRTNLNLLWSMAIAAGRVLILESQMVVDRRTLYFVEIRVKQAAGS